MAVPTFMWKPLLGLAGGVLALHAGVQTAYAASIPGQGTWTTSLQARDLDSNVSNGAEAYYDTSLNITWLADGFLARTQGYVAGQNYPAGGPYLWSQANQWAQNLDIYGISDWRLPHTTDLGALGCAPASFSGGDCGYNVDPASSEMAHLYFVTLGNISYINDHGTVNAGYGLTNSGPFQNVYSVYWSQSSVNASTAWSFDTGFGSQTVQSKEHYLQGTWAVVDGDRGIPMVPEPPAHAMMALGLLGMAVAARRAGRRGARASGREFGDAGGTS